MSQVVGVIPARYGSTRFPGKPLALIAGRPMLAWVVDGARQSRLINQLIIATDDQRIQELGEKLKIKVVMTDSDIPSGSDRVWRACEGLKAEVVVNIQGDEPLLKGSLLDQLIQPMLDNPQLAMATLGKPLAAGDLESPQTAKIVLNHRDEAIYFSRLPIPYSRVDAPSLGGVCLKHIGLYAFRKPFLQEFCQHGPTEIERVEGLEQLRALYMGARIKVVRTEVESWGVDTPEDVKKIEKLLQAQR